MAKGKNLVIVESPGKIKTIAKVLGKDFAVKASVGHVRDLAKAKKGESKKDIVQGVGYDFTPRYVALEDKQKVLADLKKAVETADKVYLCPDPDREGEAIAWHLQEALELEPEKTVRVTFDEITPRGIKAAFENPRKVDMDKVNAQQARRILDRIVGFKLSPLLWDKIGRGLSAGRVQSVAVRLIVEREREIDAFTAEEYWRIAAQFSFDKVSFEADLRALEGKIAVASAEDLAKYKKHQTDFSSSGVMRILIENEKEARALAAVLQKARYKITNYEVKEVADRPYPPFATSQLQQAAANRLSFDAKRTMRIAQELYQGVMLGSEGPIALITYMRTDSFRISQDALGECREFIVNKFGDKFLPEKPNYYKSKAGGQDAHECIRPTHVEITPDSIKQHLREDQYKLYKLIWERFVASQMLPALFDATTCDISAEGENTRNAVFRATGRVLKFEGWLATIGGARAVADAHVEASAKDREKGDELDTPDENENAKARPKGPQVLPAMKLGDRPALEKLEPLQKFTQPPPRYTEASLVRILEREGIGRPSTYATIISTIQERGYVTKLGRGGRGAFKATPVGFAVTERLVQWFDHSILDLGFTRKMESELDKIEEAHQDWKKTLTQFYEPFTKDLSTASEKMSSTKDTSEKTDFECPECKAFMEKRFSRYGHYLRCSRHPECKTTLRLDDKGNIQKKDEPLKTGIKCDLCGTDVVKSVGRFGAFLACEKYLADKSCPFTMKLNKKDEPIRKFAPLPTDLKCEKCEAPVVIRVTFRGKNRRAFLSCSRFPKCRYASELPEALSTQGDQALDQWRIADAKNRHDLELYRVAMKMHEELLNEEEEVASKPSKKAVATSKV